MIRPSAVLLVMASLSALRFVVWLWEGDLPSECFPARDLRVAGEVVSVRARNSGMLNVDLVIDHKEPGTDVCAGLRGAKVRLSWYRTHRTLPVGSHADLIVRLRRPWGMKNPGAFDYEAWLAGKEYAATGYIKREGKQSEQQPHIPPGMGAEAGTVYAGVLRAIGTGDQTYVSDRQWSMFRRTGTLHLMVISGLHVGVFAALAYAASQACLRLIVMHSGWLVPHHAALIVATVAVGAFAWRSGLQPPVVRATLGFALSVLCVIMLRRIPWWRGLLAVAGVATIIQPAIVFQQGFWLSYVAVFCLLATFVTRWRTSTWVRGIVFTQGALLLGLSPWIGALSGEVPLISPVANLLVVPLMSLVVIPLAVAGFLGTDLLQLHTLGSALLTLADLALVPVFAALELLEHSTVTVGYFSPWRAALCFVAGLSALTPLSVAWRSIAVVGCLLMLVPNLQAIPWGAFRVTVLDVGQGSGALLDTSNHRLVIDAGPSFASGFNTGDSIVIPALYATGLARLDGIVISHGDIDHAGGLEAVRARFPGAWVLQDDSCVDGTTWRWDGVEFTVHTLSAGSLSRNDASCTVFVSGVQATAFFSGDISSKVEPILVGRVPGNVTALVAPHHGSAGSSHPSFVRHMQPRIVIFSAGKDNRYGHPRTEVLVRYAHQGSRQFVTARHGAVQWQSHLPERVITWREPD